MRFLKALMFWLGLMGSAATYAQAPVPAAAPDPQNIWHLELSTGGMVTITLRPDVAPAHIERIKLLTRAGFYDGVIFHRVIEGFMAQTGDPDGNGQGGSPLPDLKAEFNGLPHLRGTVSMARTAENNDTANSQFFLLFLPTITLDGKYTVFGRITAGMQYVDMIERGEPPVAPSKITRAWIEADGRNAPRVALVIPAPVAAVTPPPVTPEVPAATP